MTRRMLPYLSMAALFSALCVLPADAWPAGEASFFEGPSNGDGKAQASGSRPTAPASSRTPLPGPVGAGTADGPGFGGQRGTISIEAHKSAIHQCTRDISRASIADPDIADIRLITPRQVLILAKKKPGVTNLILWHGEEHADIYTVRVFILGDLVRALNDHIHQFVPGARVTAAAASNGVLLNGRVSSQQMLERVLIIARSFDVDIVNLITVTGSQQVQLEVKIAEVSRSAAKKMGLGFLFKGDIQAGLFPSGGVIGSLSASNPLNKDPLQNLSSSMVLQSAFGSAFQLALHGVSDDFLGILSLLKGQNLAHLLATPTLVTMSGQEAEFLVGGEFPIPISGDHNDITVQYKRYGIILRFTPYVTGRETITIKVAPEVSNPDYTLSVSSGGVTVPGLKTRRGATTLQLKDGQTFIMAGLLMEDMYTTINKIPFLGDIPILGTLFTSKEFEKNETELMVMVTARLVRALNADEVPVNQGGAQTGNVNDADFFILNRLPGLGNATPPRPGEPSRQDKPTGNPLPPDRPPRAAPRSGDQNSLPENAAEPPATGKGSADAMAPPGIPGFRGPTGYTR